MTDPVTLQSLTQSFRAPSRASAGFCHVPGHSSAARGEIPAANHSPLSKWGVPLFIWGAPRVAESSPRAVRGAPRAEKSAPLLVRGAPPKTESSPPTVKSAPPTARGVPLFTGGDPVFAQKPCFSPKRARFPVFAPLKGSARCIYAILGQRAIKARTRVKTISGVMAVRHSIRLCHAQSDFMQGEQGSGWRSEFAS